MPLVCIMLLLAHVTKLLRKNIFLLPLYPKQHCMKWENINSLGVCLSLPSMAVWDTARLRALHCPRLLLLAFFFLLSDWWVIECPWCWSCWPFGNFAFPREGWGWWLGFFPLVMKAAGWNWVEGWENTGIVYTGKQANEEWHCQSFPPA